MRALLRITMVLSLLAATLMTVTLSPAPAEATPNYAAMSSEVFAQINAERAGRGMAPLERLALADGHATTVANHLLNLGQLDGHALFSANVNDWYFSGQGIWGAGENLAFNNGTTNQAVVNLMNSASHRANILSTGFTHVGVGLACSSSGRLYTVMHFTSDDYVAMSSAGGSTPANPIVTDPTQGSTCDSASQPDPVQNTGCTFFTPQHAAHLGAQTTTDVGGQVFRLYVAYFSRVPDTAGFNYWLNQVDTGQMTMREISAFFANSTEFRTTYGPISNYSFTNLVYQNVLCRNPDATGYGFWLNNLDLGAMNRGEVMLFFSDSTEFRTQTKTA